MSSLPTLPQRTWLERLSLAVAFALALIGLQTLAGLWLNLPQLLQPFGGPTFLKLSGGLAFIVLGGALVLVELGRRRFAALALIATAIGLRALYLDLGSAAHALTEGPVTQMPRMLAASLVLGSLVLAWRALHRAGQVRIFAEAVVGSGLASAGLSTLLGYGVGLPGIYRWGTDLATSPMAAIALVLLGLALVLLAWRESMRTEGKAPSWSAMPAVVACLTLTVILWIGLRAREQTYMTQTTQAQMDQFAVQIKGLIDRQASELERVLARPWGDRDSNNFTLWDADANRQMAGVGSSEAGSADLGCTSLAFVDLTRHTIWVYPRTGNETALGFDHASIDERRAALEEARATNGPVVSTSTPILVPGGQVEKGFVIYTPVIRRGAVAGFVAAEFTYRGLLQTIARKLRLDEDYSVTVAIAGESVFSLASRDPTRGSGGSQDRTYPIANRRIQVSLTPSDAAVARSRRYLPELALAAGFGITLLLGLSVHLARSAHAGQRAAELSNKRLFAENEERRRVEARLKISDDRLRLALDSTQIGIFEWSVAPGHVYYSPGLWAMLGYEHEEMPSTVEAWQSLVHPDDLELYRSRTDAQLQGAATFIDPEYRVRAGKGDWRWVYTRSKSVAAGPDGRPTRIVGTVQDITARREAELALRESQAEARKLSLVAAKTDNPVLIGSPDGRIEWANEAFCRVMEYSLEEVVGKNPAHFMIGPETNPRTVVRIRAAMARGQGISTDVVNYSKSGQKYHLHLEIQPVRGATGEVENFIAVETDITARVETEHQLRRAKAEADDASRAKSEFLASMSHEIRTPMNGVIGMTSLLMETTLTAEQRDFVNTIRTSGDALLTIINDILDFSKIESGKMELEHAPFELALCLEEALELFALQASAKKLEIGYHIAPEAPGWIMGDVTRLRQVIVNLVNNAVKFTPGGSISVEVRPGAPVPVPDDPDGAATAPVLEFSVRDTGIGIPPDRLGRLFKAFSQVDSSTTRKYGGTGLGLAISQRLCELMGGRIRVESTPGEGSVFIFTIQAEPAPAGEGAALPALPAPLREGPVFCVEDHPVTRARLRTVFESWGAACTVFPSVAALTRDAAKHPAPSLLVLDAGEIEETAAHESLNRFSCPRLILYPFGQTAPQTDDGPPLASSPKPIRTGALLQVVVRLFQAGGSGTASPFPVNERTLGEEIPLEVLVAEDNAVNQKVALRFLERLGYRADAVANGLEAVTTLENREYDLVLMDVQMPEMDGYEATRQIRARLPAERQPKIIALTANAMQGDRDAAVAAGMDDYVSKPVKVHEIAAAIRRQFPAAAKVAAASELDDPESAAPLSS